MIATSELGRDVREADIADAIDHPARRHAAGRAALPGQAEGGGGAQRREAGVRRSALVDLRSEAEVSRVS